MSGDDGYRLFADGEVIVERWRDQGDTPAQGVLALEEGQEVDLVLEYYQNGGDAVIRMGAVPVEMVLAERAFAFYDPEAPGWVVEPGAFEIRAGRSFRDLRARATVVRE